MKVKIHRKEILDLCNWKHEDIGIFIKFLNGLCTDGYLVVEGEIVPIELTNNVTIDPLEKPHALLRSTCCSIGVKNTFSDKIPDAGSTWWYVCLKCGKPCDVF